MSREALAFRPRKEGGEVPPFFFLHPPPSRPRAILRRCSRRLNLNSEPSLRPAALRPREGGVTPLPPSPHPRWCWLQCRCTCGKGTAWQSRKHSPDFWPEPGREPSAKRRTRRDRDRHSRGRAHTERDGRQNVPLSWACGEPALNTTARALRTGLRAGPLPRTQTDRESTVKALELS